jgi:hypothetical protein
LTGGPCGGKTTAMSKLKDYLTGKGFKVFMVPELPTITMVGGGMIVMGKLTREEVCKFQCQLVGIQKSMEDYFINLAVISGQPSVILFDRGCVDPKAYMDDETFQTFIDETGHNLVYLRDKRYDAVLHLITAADGAE